jgi:SAM-dependent methyltransferase
MVRHSAMLASKALSYLNLDGVGLEIAPYYDPFLKKSEYEIYYTDYIETEKIREKALANPDLSGAEIPAVDFVWTPGFPLRKCAPPELEFDYVVASHVMEHVPNPLGWLNELCSVLKEGGKIAVFLPERRLNSDYFRATTGFSQLVQWWIEQPDVPTPGQVVDFMSSSFLNFHGKGVGWDAVGSPPDAATRAYSDHECINAGIFVFNERQYIDVHCTVWDSDSCADIFRRCGAGGLMNVDVSNATPDGAEFLVVFTKRGAPSLAPPRKDALRQSLDHAQNAFREAVAIQDALKAHIAFLQQDGAGKKSE